MKKIIFILLLIPSLSWGNVDLKNKVLGCLKLFKDIPIYGDYYYFDNDNRLFSLMLPLGIGTTVIMVEEKYELTPTKIFLYNSFENKIEAEINRQSGTYLHYSYKKSYSCIGLDIKFTDDQEFKRHYQGIFDWINESIDKTNKF